MTGSQPSDNLLLYGLPEDAYQRLAGYLAYEPLRAGRVLYRQTDEIDRFYFVTSGLVSLCNTAEDGHTTKLCVVGHEGGVGLTLLFGQYPALLEAMVQVRGDAWSLRRDLLQREFARGGAVQRILLRYVQARITEMAQAGMCSNRHLISEQLCSWLVLILDRTDCKELSMTQETIAQMLGVRRASVTMAARELQDAGLIRYRRGYIQVVDCGALRARACECYHVIRGEYDRLYQDVTRQARR